VYQRIEKAKQENPDDQDLWKLLDNIGMATVGWYFFSNTALVVMSLPGVYL
jgi:hypothetical protein